MSLVVVGANPKVAHAAATLPVAVIHVQLPDAPPLREVAGTVYTVDFRQPAAFAPFVDDVLRPLEPSAVVSLTEPGLEPAALATERLGTPGARRSVVHATRNKLAMRRILAAKAPHLNPAFAPGDDPIAVEQLFVRKATVVAKPVDGSGSSDVALVHDLADLPQARRSSDTLLEQYVEGSEFSIETMSAGGRHTIIGVAEKATTTGFVELSHVMPPHSLDDRRKMLVERAVVELLDALQLNDGPSHTEVKIDGDRVTVIETHNRLGGDGIADLVQLTRGINWRRCAVGWPIGAGFQRGPASAPAAATVFFTAPPGRVTGIAERPALQHGTIVDWDVTARVGDRVGPLRSSLDRLGGATLTAASPTACAAAVAELTAMRIVTTAPVL